MLFNITNPYFVSNPIAYKKDILPQLSKCGCISVFQRWSFRTSFCQRWLLIISVFQRWSFSTSVCQRWLLIISVFQRWSFRTSVCQRWLLIISVFQRWSFRTSVCQRLSLSFPAFQTGLLIICFLEVVVQNLFARGGC